MFPLSKFFRKGFCSIKCAPSQCTLYICRVIMCFENLSHFFKLELMVREFFYFFQLRRYENSVLEVELSATYASAIPVVHVKLAESLLGRFIVFALHLSEDAVYWR
ncbi:unnamed protein product [Prunus brigantina]